MIDDVENEGPESEFVVAKEIEEAGNAEENIVGNAYVVFSRIKCQIVAWSDTTGPVVKVDASRIAAPNAPYVGSLCNFIFARFNLASVRAAPHSGIPAIRSPSSSFAT
jgi:hypothetical protein